jgi:hypothetical protein
VVIKIDLTSLSGNFKSIIIHEIGTEYHHQYNLDHTNVGYADVAKDVEDWTHDDENIITLTSHDKSDLQKIERTIKDILIKQKIDDYVVLQDSEEEGRIVILKREHGEQLGVYHCRHCAMAFDDEIQLAAHLRMHYFI